MVAELEQTQQDAASEPRRHGIGVDDGTRIEHGDGCAYSAGEGRAHGMRGDGVGIADFGALSCGARDRRDTSGGVDGRGAWRERDEGLVGGHSRTEQDAANEPRWDRICVDYGTRIEHGGCCVYSTGDGETHGMRGDGVGVGDIGAVSCGARGRRNTSGGDDGRVAWGKRDAGLVGGHGRTE